LGTIIKATPEQHAELVDIWEASVRATHHFLSEADITSLRPRVLTYLAPVSLYAHQSNAGDLLGFVGVSKENVDMLFIAPPHRGKGIGKQLLLYAVEHLGAKTLDVNEQNSQAVGFYEHLGFRVVRRSPCDSTGNPFPLLHMALATSL
jgi:putative acetyltransferase